jgi:hypothetical protein
MRFRDVEKTKHTMRIEDPEKEGTLVTTHSRVHLPLTSSPQALQAIKKYVMDLASG